MKHVKVDPHLHFDTITPDGVTMYDRKSLYDLQRGDLVHYKTPDADATFVVKEVTPAQFEGFGEGLQVVHMSFVHPQPTPKPTETMSKWRTGRSVGRTIYAMSGDIPGDSDTLIGVMDTPALAEAAVEGHNAVLFGDSNSNLWGRGN